MRKIYGLAFVDEPVLLPDEKPCAQPLLKTFLNGFASREESVISKNAAFSGFFACYVFAYGGQTVMESDFSPKR